MNAGAVRCSVNAGGSFDTAEDKKADGTFAEPSDERAVHRHQRSPPEIVSKVGAYCYFRFHFKGRTFEHRQGPSSTSKIRIRRMAAKRTPARRALSTA